MLKAQPVTPCCSFQCFKKCNAAPETPATLNNVAITHPVWSTMLNATQVDHNDMLRSCGASKRIKHPVLRYRQKKKKASDQKMDLNIL